MKNSYTFLTHGGNPLLIQANQTGSQACTAVRMDAESFFQAEVHIGDGNQQAASDNDPEQPYRS